MRLTVRLILLLTLTTAAVAPCSGQARIEVTPSVGVYEPTSDYGISGLGTAAGEFSASVHQNGATILGGQVEAWFGRNVGVEVSAGFGRGRAVSTAVFTGFACRGGIGTCRSVTDTSTQLAVGGVRVLFSPGSTMSGHLSPYVIGGIGMVSHDAAANDFVFTKTTWGADVGVGVRVPVTAALAPHLAVEGFTDAASTFVVSVGLSATIATIGHRTVVSP